MKTGGWIFIAAAWSFVTVLVVYSFLKLFGKKS